MGGFFVWIYSSYFHKHTRLQNYYMLSGIHSRHNTKYYITFMYLEV